jgi:hypothetical protein
MEGEEGKKESELQASAHEAAGEVAGERRTVSDRRLVIHDRGEGAEEESEGDDEEEFVFGEDDSEEGLLRGWFAVARYYSAHSFPVKVLFSDLFSIWGDGTARDLGSNKYLLEFSSDKSLSFAIRGGPWSFRGDAVILVQYDGLTKLSEVTIESIPLWIRIYDIPVSMMTKAFVTVLGEVGRVMEVGDAVRDFKRVRVDFDLSKALMPHVSIKVRGKGVMEFVVKYESVPHFCFLCGHIGHADRECPDEDLYEEGERYGIELRTSPFKRGAGRLLSFHATSSPAKRGLNFSGEQKDRVFYHTSSSSLNANRQGPLAPHGSGSGDQRHAAGGGIGIGGTSKVAMSMAAAEALSQDVQKMALGKRPRTANSPAVSRDSGVVVEPQKVSGLDSYNGSSEASLGSDLYAPISVQDRLRTAKVKAIGSLLDRRNQKDIAKSKRNKKVLSLERIAQSFVGLQQGGWKQTAKDKEMEGNQQKLTGDINMQDQEMATNGISPASSNALGDKMNLDVNLTGPHGEARQEK